MKREKVIACTVDEAIEDAGETERRYSVDALQAGGLGAWAYDPAGEAFICSPRCRELFGLPPVGEPITSAWVASVHVEDLPRLQRIYGTATDVNGTGEIRAEFRTIGARDGKERWVRVKGKALFGKGKVVRIAGIVEDITVRKRVELELLQDLRFSQALTTHFGDGVYALDRAGHMTFLNGAGEELLGWREWELVGRDPHEVIHFQRADGSAFPREVCPLLAVLESGETVRCEDDVFTRKDGTLLPVAYTSSPIKENGETVGAVVTFRDIRARKATETEREALLVSERAARSMAEHALRAKDDVIGTLAHDLRTPLNAISGWAQILTSGTVSPEELREGLASIDRNARAQSKLLDELMGKRRAALRAANGGSADRGVSAYAVDPSVAANLAGLRVLVVDDETDARNLVKRVLESCDVLVLTANNAPDAMRLVEQARPDVLVSDIGMPVVDGYMLLRQIRAMGKDRGGDVPAIALTAFARSEDRTRALLAGYLVHITKPIEASELIATVASLAGRIGVGI
jgi:PAS domain S-box-containing protein